MAGALLATLATLLLVAKNGLASEQTPTTFALVLWKWNLALYVGLGTGVGLMAWVLSRLLRRPLAAHAVIAATAALGLAAVLAANGRAAMLAFSLDGGGARFRYLVPAGLVAGCAALALLGWASRSRRAHAAALAAAALTVALALGAFWPAGASEGGTMAALPAVTPERRPLVLIGVDGADWAYLRPLMERGELPHFAKLVARGASARLQTLQPTLSPIVWTTIATGHPPRRHGVRGFTVRRLRGVEAAFPQLRPIHWLGQPRLHDWLEARGEIFEAPVTSTARRVPAYWNVASAFRQPVDVVGWWATWPSEPVDGRMVTDRLYFEMLVGHGGRRSADHDRLTWPPGLAERLADDVVLPHQVSYDDIRRFADVTPAEFEPMRVSHPSSLNGIRHELTYFISSFETSRRIALRLAGSGAGARSDFMVLFRIVDKTSHTALFLSDLANERLPAPPEDVRAFRGTVARAYAAVDAALGQILERVGDANVVVVSDHGFELEGEGDARGYNHTRAPDGVFIAAGPAFRKGDFGRLSVYDVMPLMLRVKGLPVPDDLDGVVPPALLTESVPPARRIASYGLRRDLRLAEGNVAAEREEMERLRALGYLR